MRRLMIARAVVFSVLGLLAIPLCALEVGTARVDITPTEPIRLNGYGGRNRPSDGIAQHLHAKALAIGSENPSILITADIIGVSQSITDEVRRRLQASHHVPPERVAICATHTHTGPSLQGILEDIFMSDLPVGEKAAIERYTRDFTDKLYRVAVAALDARQTGQLDWGVGEVNFAVNRRVLENGRWKGFGEVPDGPIDHSLPLLRVTDAGGQVIALLVNYACHCTTLGGDFNRVHGDWAGRAAELLEMRHPKANALIAIGCGADANPRDRGRFESIEPHARALADEVDRVLGTNLKRLPATTAARFNAIRLPLDPLPSTNQWRELAGRKDRWSHYGRKMLSLLQRGETLRRSLSYEVQTWQFGRELAMVFLPGEVVVDYSHRLKELFQSDRLWINAYANDAPCYIPSRRLYDEGGYEVDRNMWYYGHPTRLSKDTEELVLDEVLRQLPHDFYSPATLRQMPAPIDKSAALETIRTRTDLQVELVAAEPLVMDPVDIAWGSDGRLWVVEMADYPLGLDDHGRPGGRVRFLEDTDNDGAYDRSTLFADGLNFPSSILPWRDGVLITAAPDILFARDTDGDGRADQWEKRFSGFGEGNQQHRVNGLQWGLDNLVHSANGDSDGEVLSHRTGRRINIRGRDFCFDPETGELETEYGRTQHGRCRDDAGNWFGVNNSWPGWHITLEERYQRHNPHISWPDPRQHLQSPPSAGPVFPASRTLNRLNDFSRVNRFTSACGSTVYRDDLFGDGFRGNYFVCEPVHNLVRREVLAPTGASFRSHQPDDESGREFFASTDNWSRPVSVRTGPDGALYVVDMYRFLIEHPQWVPADWQRKLEFRAGHDKGRIYRLAPRGRPLRAVPRLSRLTPPDWIRSLESPNGLIRDQAHQLLLWHRPADAVEPLRQLALEADSPWGRLHALCVLEGLKALDAATLKQALKDDSPHVLRRAVRLSESHQDREPGIAAAFARLARDPKTDAAVRRQLAWSLGQGHHREVVPALLNLSLHPEADTSDHCAVLASSVDHVSDLAHGLWLQSRTRPPDAFLLSGLTRTAVARKDTLALHRLALLHAGSGSLMATFLDQVAWGTLSIEARDELDPHLEKHLLPAFKSDSPDSLRIDALRLLRHAPPERRPEMAALEPLLSGARPPAMQTAAAQAAIGVHGINSLIATLNRWPNTGTAARKALMEAALRRSDWIRRLLDHLESDPTLRGSVTTVHRVALLNHRDKGIRERAEAIWGAGRESDRTRLIQRYADSMPAAGSAERGRTLFATACASCHVGQDGRAPVGPDLASLSDYSTPTLLAAVLDPNRAVEDKFLAYRAITRDGTELSGILVNESSSEVRLADATGQAHSISRDQLASLSSSGRSLMPEGFEDAIPPEAMADLLAHLRALAARRTVKASADGAYSLTPALAQVEGGLTVTEDALVGIARGDVVRWNLSGLPAGHYEIVAESSVATEYQGKPFHVTIGAITADGIFETTRALNRYRSRKFGNIRIPENLADAEVTLRHDLSGPQLSIRSLGLIPVH